MADKSFEILCKEIKFNPANEFDGVKLLSVQPTLEGYKNWVFDILFEEHIEISQYMRFKNAMLEKFPNCSINLIIQNSIRDKKTISDYLKYVINSSFKKLEAISCFITPQNLEIEEKNLNFLIPIKNAYDKFKEFDFEIIAALSKIGYDDLRPIYKLVESNKSVNKGKQIVTSIIDSFQNIVSETKKNKENIIAENKTFYNNKASRNNQNVIEMSISNALITFEQIRVMLKGEIFFLEWKTTNTNKRILNMRISDYNEAITIKFIQDINEEKPNLKEGDTLYIKGILSDDPYTKTKYVLASGKNWFELTSPIISLLDDAEAQKRIDLAIRTNMSAQDGISSPEEYIKAIKKFGHEAIAITDLDNVQSFPSFYNALKKDKEIKPIYGATVSSVSLKNSIFIGYKDFNLNDAEYVVFDLETTGLSSRFDDIIEFGALIIKNGVQTEKIQFFLQTNKVLSEKIRQLTNIDNMMLRSGLPQEQGIKKIYQILKGRIAVAHNGSFDMRMCFQKFKEFGLDTSNLVCIDTLRVSYLLDTNERLHKLERVCKRFNIDYNVAEAHRADYDANVLGEVWLRMIARLKVEKNIHTAKELFEYDTTKWSKRKRATEIRVLAKNQKGLKELFSLLSTSLTNDYAEGPKFYIENKDKYKNLFFGSGSNQSLLWDKVLFGTDDEIIEEIKNFDYIELPPISSFIYYIKLEEISLDNLKLAYKDLIKKASYLNKLCVATSDARYVYDYQKLIHAIYINAPSLGGGKHWLKNREQPSFKYLTTREMMNEFLFLNDEKLIKDIVINNPKKIASEIEEIEVIKNKLYVPSFDNSEIKLRELVYKNLYAKYGSNPDQKIIDRIEKELTPIIKYGYSAIYWISHKLVKRSNEDGYLVGSRGSVGSSIVANLSEISEVNPLEPHYLCQNCKYFEWNNDENIYSGWDLPDKKCPKCNTLLSKDGHNIPFETFLGFEANKVPDIDLNFSGEYQPIIHNLVKELFGNDHSFRAGTISKIATKTAFGFCEKYMHEVRANEPHWSRTYLDFLASKAAGVKRTTGQHPGGIIVIPKEFDVEDFTPVNYPANDTSSAWRTTHFNFESIHDNVLKLDLLGHDDPTTIRMLENLTKKSVKEIPKFDAEVMKLFYSTESLGIDPQMIDGETTGAYGLPEFGTSFVRGMLKDSQPRTFNDLILLSGLSHGTNVWAGNAEELVKKGFKLKDCVCCRDDIMQGLMKKNIEPIIAFEIMERVRKGKGLTKEQENLLVANKVPDWYINSLKKIEYMFPKAHATAYVIMAWRIGWYKLYYPLEFYASYFSIRPDAIDIETMSAGYSKVSALLAEYKSRKNSRINPLSAKEAALITTFEITKEMFARGYSIKNVSLEKSQAKDWIIDKESKSLIPPFIVIDGLGDTVAESIIKARNEAPFLSIEDLIERAKINIKICGELRRLNILNSLDETNQVELF